MKKDNEGKNPDIQGEDERLRLLGSSFTESMESNMQLLKDIFNCDDTLIFREFNNENNTGVRCCIVFIDGMIKNEIVNENIIKPVIKSTNLDNSIHTLDALQYRTILSNNVERANKLQPAFEAIINGDTVLLVEGFSEALMISSQGWQTRPIEEPQTEKLLRGPREGFTESLLTNLTLLRRKLKTPDLKFKFRTLGARSNTKICVTYIDDIVNKKILEEVYKRLDGIDIDAIIATGYIQEFIKDAPFSPFKTIGSTERPDALAAKLLEGRIGIFADGTPVALTVPHVFIELFQSNEDYYTNFYFSSINRIVRIIGFILSISVPAIYTALVTFHQEMIPTPLIISIAAARQGLPFPTIIEAVALLIVFETLREAGTRMPSYIGQALSIVGALVIGQAAVDARLVSAPMVIVIALSGITGLMLQKLTGAAVIVRSIFLILASILGLYGFFFGVAGLIAYLMQVRSFGVPYMANMSSLFDEDLKDVLIRAPWWYMKSRPKFIAKNNYIRQSSGGRKNEKS